MDAHEGVRDRNSVGYASLFRQVPQRAPREPGFGAITTGTPSSLEPRRLLRCSSSYSATKSSIGRSLDSCASADVRSSAGILPSLSVFAAKSGPARRCRRRRPRSSASAVIVEVDRPDLVRIDVEESGHGDGHESPTNEAGAPVRSKRMISLPNATYFCEMSFTTSSARVPASPRMRLSASFCVNTSTGMSVTTDLLRSQSRNRSDRNRRSARPWRGSSMMIPANSAAVGLASDRSVAPR